MTAATPGSSGGPAHAGPRGRRAPQAGRHTPLGFRPVGTFTVGGVALAVLTAVLVIAQT